MVSHEDLAGQLKESIENKEAFWERAAEKLVWTKRWTKVLDDSNSPYTRWFVGGETNLCYNCLDRHVESGRGHKVLYIHDSPVTQTRTSYTYKETLDKVSRTAGLLRKLGVEKGDVVLNYTAMMPEGAFAMLACARIGAIHAAVPGGLPARDLAQRIDLSQPKVVVVGSHGYHSSGWMNYKAELDAAYDLALKKPDKILVIQRENMDIVPLVEGRDVDWRQEVVSVDPVPCVPLEASEPTFIVYTSGSTGVPKAVLHSGASFAVRWANDGPTFFGKSEDNEIFFGTTSFGWIAGHNCILYGPALAHGTVVIFEGDPLLSEDPRAMYRVIQDNSITRCFIRPGLLKVIKGLDSDGVIASEYKLDRLRQVWCGGERLNLSTAEWVKKTFQVSVWNIYGQTEGACLMYGAPDDTVTKEAPVVADYGVILPGFDFHLLTPEGQEAESGRLVARLPLPPGCLIGVHKNNEAFIKYFAEYPGFYDTCDEGVRNERGCLKVENRADDIMKVGLYYLAAPAVEEVVMRHAAIQDCVVVSTTDLIWREIPLILYVNKKGVIELKDETEKELKGMLLDAFGPSLPFGRCVQVKELPVTRTGKAHRPSCKTMARGQEIKGTGAVENPHVFPDIVRELKAHGYGKDALLD